MSYKPERFAELAIELAGMGVPDCLLSSEGITGITDAQLEDIRSKGFDFVEGLNLETEDTFFVLTVVSDSVYARAIDLIAIFEREGLISGGSHYRAMDAILEGTFESDWGQYIVDNRGEV